MTRALAYAIATWLVVALGLAGLGAAFWDAPNFWEPFLVGFFLIGPAALAAATLIYRRFA